MWMAIALLLPERRCFEEEKVPSGRVRFSRVTQRNSAGLRKDAPSGEEPAPSLPVSS